MCVCGVIWWVGVGGVKVCVYVNSFLSFFFILLLLFITMFDIICEVRIMYN